MISIKALLYADVAIAWRPLCGYEKLKSGKASCVLNIASCVLNMHKRRAATDFGRRLIGDWLATDRRLKGNFVMSPTNRFTNRATKPVFRVSTRKKQQHQIGLHMLNTSHFGYRKHRDIILFKIIIWKAQGVPQ